jgi:hypothetical protein
MPEPIAPDDEFMRTARAYLGQLRGSAPRANLPRRAVSSAMSRRRRFSVGALLGGAALVVAGASAAAIAIAMHNSPVPQRPVRPVIQSPVVSSPSATVSPSPSAGPSPSAAAVASVTIRLVTAHDGAPNTGEGPGNFDFQAGHSLTCDNSIRYDNTTVVQLPRNSLVSSCMLSGNGLHYLYALYPRYDVYVDGHLFHTVRPPQGGSTSVVGLSDDGQSVMYETDKFSSTQGGAGTATLYRNTTVLYTTNDRQSFDAAASADLQHYVVVDGPASTWVGPGPEKVLYDGRLVVPLGGRDFFIPVISSNGMHWGVYISGSSGGGHALIDGRAVQGPWECAALITDQGHWTMFNVVTNSAVTDGVSRHVTVNSFGNAFVALTDGGEHRAALVGSYPFVLTVDGSPHDVPANVRAIEFVGTTLYVYYTAT